MATDRQIAANRANARKSTGPRTLAGRGRSGQNARVHGLATNARDLQNDAEHQQTVHDLAGPAASDDRVKAARDLLCAEDKLRRIAEWRQKAYAEFELSANSIGYIKIQRAAALDRYERYAYTQLYRAISKLEQ